MTEATKVLPELKTVGDVHDMLDEMVEAGDLIGHVTTLLGPRTRGSTTEEGLDVLPRNRKLQVAAPSSLSEGCRCFYCYAPELGGRTGAVPLGEALRTGLTVKARLGDHGEELYIDEDEGRYWEVVAEIIGTDDTYISDFPYSASVCNRNDGSESTDKISIIIGWHGEEGSQRPVIFTWHPGEPLRPFKQGWVRELHEDTAVKTHNG